MEKIWEFRILQSSGNNAGTIDNGSTGGTGENEKNSYQVVGFILWYLVLVLCCLVPAYCEYRRRRMVESRLAQQHFDLQQLHQQQLNRQSNFLLLDRGTETQLQRDNEEFRRIRNAKIGERLRETTLVLTNQDFETQTDENDEDRLDVTVDGHLEDMDEPTTRIKLPTDAANGNRSVSGLCAICLGQYISGEKITWSPKACLHAFHEDCIIQWLAKKEELKCPVCRQLYCDPIHMDGAVPVSEGLLLSSFASALSYARSHATRFEVGRSNGNRPFFVAFEPTVRVHIMENNNDLSLRENSEGNSREIEMGLASPSNGAADHFPATDSGLVEIEEAKNSESIDISDNREQRREYITETINDGESERGEVGQPDEPAIETSHARARGVERGEVNVKDSNSKGGSTEEK